MLLVENTAIQVSVKKNFFVFFYFFHICQNKCKVKSGKAEAKCIFSIVDLCTNHVEYIGTLDVYKINFVQGPLALRSCNYQYRRTVQSRERDQREEFRLRASFPMAKPLRYIYGHIRAYFARYFSPHSLIIYLLLARRLT